MKNNIHKITKKVEGNDWKKCIDESFKKNVKNVKLDGFRKGNIPRDIFNKNFGEESLYNDAINICLDSIYKEVLENDKLVPVVEPSVDIKSIDSDHVEVEFTIITAPEVKLGEYKNLGVKFEEAKVTKKEIDEEIELIKTKLADIVVKENAPVASGDVAVIDFEGFVDGKSLEGGKGENYNLEIGSNSFIPGFEEGLIGKNVNEEVELSLKFPEEYVEDLKGKDVLFKVKINEIKTKIIPELNEELYLDLGYENIKTEEEFRKEVEKVIADRKNAENEDKFIDKLLEKACDNLKVDINEEIIDDEVHRIMHNYEEQLKRQGMSLESYYQMTGSTHEQLHKSLEGEAVKRIKCRYLLEEIASVENIKFTDKEVKAKIKEMAENYGISEEELIKAFGNTDVITYDMKMHKALEILRDSNK